jgi:hypothetical protein
LHFDERAEQLEQLLREAGIDQELRNLGVEKVNN